MDQPSITLGISGWYPNAKSDAVYDLALERLFGIETKDIIAVVRYKDIRIPKAAYTYLVRTCCLARHILQQCGLPAFSPEVIHDFRMIDRGSNTFRLALNAPSVDQTNRKQLAAAYGHGLKLMWLAASGDRAALKKEADALCESFIEPMRRALGRGLSTTPLLEEAYRRRIPIDHLGSGFYQLGTGARSRLIARSATDRDSSIGAMVARQKDLAESWFRSVGVPVAQTIPAKNADAAIAAANRIGFPVVVKPANLERSQGVFLDLDSEEDVRTAFERAREQCARILVQSRIAGHCHRLVAFRGRYVFGYSRLPPAVKGNGKDTIKELVASANHANSQKARHLQTKTLPFDEEALSCLLDQGLKPDDTLEQDRLAFLRKNNTPDHPGHNEIITEKVHPKNIALVERLARMFRLESVGVDFISADPTRPFHENGAAITEVNFQPQIGENTARHNLDAMFPDGDGAIEVECFVGGAQAMERGRRRLRELAARGVNAALTSHRLSLDMQAMPYLLAGVQGLRARCIALLRDPAIEALVVVVQTDEFLRTGPPFVRNVRVIHVDCDVRLQSDADVPLSAEAIAELLAALKGE